MGLIKVAVALQLFLSSISTALPAGVVGLGKKDALSSTVYDAVIVGGGPAGLSACNYPVLK